MGTIIVTAPASSLVLPVTMPGITLRAISDADRPFLARLYASTREAEMRMTGWDDAQQSIFLQSQFAAQQHAYLAYPDAVFLMVRRDGEPIGRLYVQTLADRLHVVDISLLPAAREGGVGTALMRAVIAAGKASGKGVGLHVEASNRALKWYRRLGFEAVAQKGFYLEMRREGS